MAFFTSRAERRRALARKRITASMHQHVPAWLRALQFFARNPECTASEEVIEANLRAANPPP